MLMPRVIAATLVCVVTACASQTGQTPNAAPSEGAIAGAPRATADVITLAELSDPTLGDADALSIIKRLRPAFLLTRGTTSANTAGGGIHVSIDGGPLRNTDALTTIHAHEILDIRYLSASAAAQTYGSVSVAGPVIVIRRK